LAQRVFPQPCGPTITITGPQGCGKTRWAKHLRSHVPIWNALPTPTIVEAAEAVDRPKLGASMTEKQGYMLEAALDVGFEMTNDDADEFRCTDAQLVELVQRAFDAGKAAAHDDFAPLGTAWPGPGNPLRVGHTLTKRFLYESSPRDCIVRVVSQSLARIETLKEPIKSAWVDRRSGEVCPG